jgi:hypothetical protein
MKKLLLLFAILFCFAIHSEAAESLTFKLTNPSIYYESTINYLSFDIMVKASEGSSYLYASQINCNISIANVNAVTSPILNLASGFEQSYDPPGPPLSAAKYAVTTNYNGNVLNIGIVHTQSLDSYYPAAYTVVPNVYTKFGTVYIELKAVGVNGMAGINFLTSGFMDGQQFYATGIDPWSAPYESPNVYEGTDFTELYLGRMYSSGSGWTQFGGTVNWATSVNTSVWDTAATAATITGTVAGSECKGKALRIHYGARLKIDSDHPLTATGGTTSINNERGLWITSTAAGTGSFKDNGTINYLTGGSVLVERYLSNSSTSSEWHLVSSPIIAGNASIFLTEYLMNYNEPTHQYQYIINPSTILDPMKGYATWVNSSSTKYFIGQLNTNVAGVSINTTRTYNNDSTAYDGWNLIGNPYPSGVDASLLTYTGVDATAWFWDRASGNYKVYPSAFGAAGTHSKYVPPMQGFYVHCNSTANPSPTQNTGYVVFTNSARTHILTEPFWKDGEIVPDLLRMNVTGTVNAFSDDMAVYFNPDRTIQYEPGYDALKLPGQLDAPQLYTVNGGDQLTVNAMPFYSQNVVVPMGFSVSVEDTYTFKASNLDGFSSGESVMLEDLKLQTTQDLKVNPNYSFHYTPGDNANRFLLHFGNPFVGTPDLQSEKPVNIFSYENSVYVKISSSNSINGTLTMYDMVGRKVFQANLQNKTVNKFETGLVHGTYIVTLSTSDGTFNAKVTIQ